MTIYYLLRSQIDGKYVVAKDNDNQYLLLFTEHFDALSYLNTHGIEIKDKFGVESLATSQLKPLIQRWGFYGIAVVQDPLLPKIEFFTL